MRNPGNPGGSFHKSNQRSRKQTLARAVAEQLESRTLFSVTIPAVPTPAAHWTFDDGSGTIAADSSGNGHNGTLGAGVSWVAGNVGSGAISLAGTSTGVVTVTGPVVNTAGSFTVSAWVDLASISGYQTVVSIAGTNVAGFYLGLRATPALSPSPVCRPMLTAPAPSSRLPRSRLSTPGITSSGSMMPPPERSLSMLTASRWAALLTSAAGPRTAIPSSATDSTAANRSISSMARSTTWRCFLRRCRPRRSSHSTSPPRTAFDDGTGTTAADVSGHGNTLTLGSGASWAAGRIGSNSLAVNGSATGNATNPSPVINTALSFSVSAWVNLTSVNGYQTFASIDGINTSGFYLQLRGDTGKFAFTRLASDSRQRAGLPRRRNDRARQQGSGTT